MSSSRGDGGEAPSSSDRKNPAVPKNSASQQKTSNTTSASEVTSATPDTSVQLTTHEAQKIRWEEEASTFPTPTPGDLTWAANERCQKTVVLTNIFKFTLNPSRELFRYTTIIGSIETPKPKKEDSSVAKKTEKKTERHLSLQTKRYLITKLLEEHPPTATDYTSDFRDTIISVGPLYKGFISGEKDVPHTRSGDTDELVQSKLRYNGWLEIGCPWAGSRKCQKTGNAKRSTLDSLRRTEGT